MAVTKILPRNGGLKEAIDYVLNGDKTDGHILTAHFNCDPGREYREMMKTKLETGRLDKRQCYHIIQSFKPGEITPELALEIAKAFAQEHLDGFEVVIGTHVDRHHIHSHIVFNSVNADTGEKYHSNLRLHPCMPHTACCRFAKRARNGSVQSIRAAHHSLPERSPNA